MSQCNCSFVIVCSFLQSGGDSEAPEGGPAPSTTVNETINIFSIASGHLYERFLRYHLSTVEGVVLVIYYHYLCSNKMTTYFCAVLMVSLSCNTLIVKWCQCRKLETLKLSSRRNSLAGKWSEV